MSIARMARYDCRSINSRIEKGFYLFFKKLLFPDTQQELGVILSFLQSLDQLFHCVGGLQAR